MFRYGGVSIENWRARPTSSSPLPFVSQEPRLSERGRGVLLLVPSHLLSERPHCSVKELLFHSQSNSSPTKTTVLTRKVALSNSSLTNKRQVSFTHPPTPLLCLFLLYLYTYGKVNNYYIDRSKVPSHPAALEFGSCRLSTTIGES